ncbi:MAG: GNAT family N-acetyltransferase [Aureispira sp.]
MKLQFIPIKIEDQATVLQLFKEAALRIAKMDIDHWQYWRNPPIEKVNWVEEGLQKGEFFFIKTEKEQTLGMVRILEEDLLYWGPQAEKALYIHSLVVKGAYEGQGIGTMVLEAIEKRALVEQRNYLRLDAVAKNLKLCRYYEQQGFDKVGVKTLSGSINNLYQKEL